MTTDERLKQLQDLKKGWDGFDSRPPTKSAIEATRRVLSLIQPGAAPDIEPVPGGGIQLSWGKEQECPYLEIYIDTDGEPEGSWVGQ
jgi:hypothetical protein